MYIFALLGIFIFLFPFSAIAGDTLTVQKNLSKLQIMQQSPAYQIGKQGVPLLFASALATSIDKRIQETRQVNMSSFSNHFDDYLQYAPMAAMFGMKLAGVKGRST